MWDLGFLLARAARVPQMTHMYPPPHMTHTHMYPPPHMTHTHMYPPPHMTHTHMYPPPHLGFLLARAARVHALLLGLGSHRHLFKQKKNFEKKAF